MKKAIAFVLFTVSAFGVPTAWGQDATSRGRSDAPLPPTSVHGSEADNVWTNNNRFKGPIPWADASAFGRMIPRSGISTNTANISLAAPTNVRLTNPGFVNGDGITIWGAGASITMSTPGAPTITPSIAAGGTSTGIVKTSASGSSTYKYRIIARDKFGGLTPAGSVGTTADGQATLGLQTASLTTCTRANDVVTCDTSRANGLVAGALAHVRGGSNADFTGFASVDHTNSSTEFVEVNSPIDSRGIGGSIGDSTTSAGGAVYYYFSNHLAWTPVSGAWEYYVCAQRPGDSGYHLIGTTKPSTSHWVDAQFDDYGSPFMDNQTYPKYVETSSDTPNVRDAICTAATPLPDPLTTTIVSGAGTGTLTLANPAKTAVTNQTALFDSAPNLLAAANWVSPFGGGAANIATLYIPPGVNSGSLTFVVNSYLKLPSKIMVKQAGQLVLNETLELPGDITWDGSWSNNGMPSFGFTGAATIFDNLANPGIFVTGNGILMTYSGISSDPKNGGTLMVSDSAGSVFDHISFSSSTSISDYLSMNLVMRSTASGGNNYHFDYTLFNAGPDQITDKTWTPIVYMPPNQNGTGGLLGNQGFVFHCSNCFLNRRGIEEEAAGASIELRDISTTYRQGGITPLFMFGNSNGVAGGEFKFNLTIQDTESLPTLTLLGNASVAQVEFSGVQNYGADTGGIPPPISGRRPAYFYSESSNIGKIPTRGSSATGDSYNNCRVIYPYDMTGTNGCVRQDIQTFFESSHFPAQHSLFWDMAPPSSVTAVVASGGRLAVGKTYYYDVSAIDPMGGETVMANSPSAPVTMSSGNGSAYLSWTGSMGAASYNVYRCVSAGSNCVKSDGRATGAYSLISFHTTANTLTDSGLNTDHGPPTGGSAGVTIANATGFYGPKNCLTSALSRGISFLGCFAQPTLTAARNWVPPDASGPLSLAQVEYCGATSGATQACAKTVQLNPIVVYGDVTFNAATTQSITSLPFTSSAYSCTGSDITTPTETISFISYTNNSVKINHSGGPSSDHARYMCVGY